MAATQQLPPSGWDRFSILAEVKRRGMTLSGIATDAGLYEAAGRQALHGTSLPGAEAISVALGIPFRTLFPKERGFYPSWERRIAQRNHNDSKNESSDPAEPVDTAEHVA